MWGSCKYILLITFLGFFLLQNAASAFNYAKIAGKGVRGSRSLRYLDDPAVTIAGLTRSSLKTNGSNIQKNIHKLANLGIREERINEIDAIQYTKKYSTLPQGGDIIFLECLQVKTCPLDSFSQSKVTQEVWRNQLHLQHAARCPSCNRTNIYKLSGDTTESVMHAFFKRSGWQQLQGEIGNSGIDGLYVKRSNSGAVADVLIVEAKYNTSQLAKTRTGTQMSKVWIKGNLKKLKEKAALEGRKADVKDYKQLERYVDADSYRAQEWRMNVVDDKLVIDRAVIKSKGKTIEREPYFNSLAEQSKGEGRLEIDTRNPKSKFDSDIVADFWQSVNSN